MHNTRHNLVMSGGWDRGFLLILALLLRVVMPEGVMLDFKAGSAPEIVICTGHGAMKIKPPAESGSQTKDKGVCAFAAVGPPLEQVPVAVPLAAEHIVYSPGIAPSRLSPPLIDMASPPPPAHGPPLFL